MKYFSYEIDKLPLIKIEINPSFIVTLSPLGASIVSVVFNNKEMILSPKEMKDYLRKDIYYGKTIGPICGRIKDGIIDIDNKKYQIDINEGNNSLHGGNLFPISNLFFNTSFKDNKVIFSLLCPNMQNGLPGDINYQIIYSFDENENNINLSYEVRTNMNTVIALTNHAFFHLGDPSINKLKLMIPASKFIEVDKLDMIPLKEKEILPCLDYQNEKLIIKDINDPYLKEAKTNGYDHLYKFDNKKYAILENDSYLLKIETDFDGILLYSDNYIDNVKTTMSDKSKARAVALEPQDCQLNRKILTPNEIYKRFISYKFHQK